MSPEEPHTHRPVEDTPAADLPPKDAPEPLTLRARPQPVTRLNRKVVGGLLAALAAVLCVLLAWSMRPPHPRAPALAEPPASQTALPDGLRALPTSYAEITRPAVAPPSSPVGPSAPSAPALPRQPPLANGTTPASPVPVRKPGASATVPPADVARRAAADTRHHAQDERDKARRSGLFFPGHSTASGPPLAPGAPHTPPTPGLEPGHAPDIPDDASRLMARGAEQNMQAEKRRFLQAAAHADDAATLRHRLQAPMSPYEVKAGTIIPAVLLTGINSDLPGQLLAQVREHVYDTVTGRYLLIPQGAKLLGTYDSVIAYGQNRVLVTWSRLLLPNGASLTLEGMPGVDLAGAAGYRDRVNHHTVRLVGAALLSSLLSIGTRLSQGDIDDQRFVATLGQELAAEAAQGINQAGQQIVRRQLDIQPTITVRSGFAINVFVVKDVMLTPYQD